MKFYIARQPIFDRQRRLFAYELLYRGAEEVTLTNINGERATTSLLSSTFFTEGIELISGKKRCFINFTEDLLLKKIPLSFPKTQIVVEILEDVRPTEDVVAACRFIARQGYTIALDDFIYDKRFDPLLEIASIIKIDFRLTPLEELDNTLFNLKRFDVELLAEKVETHEEYERASKMGFSYFQGYFFSKPERILIQELPAAKITLINLLAQISKKTTTFDDLHKIISVDVALSFKLLKFLNSAFFYRVDKVTSVKHAMAYLGEKELKRFVTLVIISELSSDKPDALMSLALVRAKFCELLAQQTNMNADSDELFLMGLFSLIDVMLDATMEVVMEKLPLSTLIKIALVLQTGEYAAFLNIIRSYEMKQGQRLAEALQQLNIEELMVPELYLRAVEYSNALA